MSMQEGKPLSPTVSKVLDAYLEALKADGTIDTDAVTRLDHLLRQGKAPKVTDIDAALASSDDNQQSS